MKLLYLILCFFVAFTITAQDQYPFLSEGHKHHIDCNSNEGYSSHSFEYEFEGDTIIEGMNGKIINIYSNVDIILVENDKKVYFKRTDIPGDLNLMYDFTLQEADTFVYSYYVYQENKFIDGFLKVTLVDSVEMISGEFRKRIHLTAVGEVPGSSCLFDESVWIDGIGDINHYPFYLDTDCFESNCWVRCFFDSDSLIYGLCGPDNTNQIEPDLYNVHPNPFSTNMSIDNSNTISRIELFGTSGKEYIGIELVNGEILFPEELLTGMYFLRITNKEDQIVIKRIIKD